MNEVNRPTPDVPVAAPEREGEWDEWCPSCHKLCADCDVAPSPPPAEVTLAMTRAQAEALIDHPANAVSLLRSALRKTEAAE